MDEPAINLKEGIDLRDLQDPNSEGVVFEVEEEQQLLGEVDGLCYLPPCFSLYTPAPA